MKLTKRENDLADFAAERIEALQKENDRLVQLNNALVDRVNELAIAGENVGKLAAELQRITGERDRLQNSLKAAACVNDTLAEEITQLKARAIEAPGQFQKRIEELRDGLDASAALLKTAQDERDVARQEADYLRKRAQEAEERAVQLQDQIAAQEEVIERLKAQNSNFCEEQREAKKRADATAVNLIKTKDEVARLVGACNSFKEQLARVTKEKNDIVEISNGFARERDEIRADYDARGKVIKKLRKRLHKLKKKLKH